MMSPVFQFGIQGISFQLQDVGFRNGQFDMLMRFRSTFNPQSSR